MTELSRRDLFGLGAWFVGGVALKSIGCGVYDGPFHYVQDGTEDFYGHLPEGTFPLSPEQQIEVKKVMDRGNNVIKPLVEILIENADPLFDMHGEDVNDNSVVLDNLSVLFSRMDDYFRDDRMLGYHLGDLDLSNQNIDYSFHSLFFDYGTTSLLSDDYIGFDIDYFPPYISWVLHETTHSEQDGHTDVIHDALSSLYQRSNITYEDVEEFASLVVQERDFAYLMDILFDPVDTFLEDLESGEQMDITKEEWIEKARDYESFRVFNPLNVSEEGFEMFLEGCYDYYVSLHED